MTSISAQSFRCWSNGRTSEPWAEFPPMGMASVLPSEHPELLAASV
jgi:hypothetical protein